MKTAICTIAKLENNYIREWVEYHLNLGFDKIFLYDNNDGSGEHFEDVIADYINNGRVDLINFRGRKWAQILAFNNCYNLHGKDYDWMAFIDADEFITLTKAKTITEFLSNPIYNNFDGIYLKWVYFTDNNLIEVKDNNYNCLDRFTEPDAHIHHWDQLEFGKRIIRTKLHINMNSSHGIIYTSTYHECFASGEPVVINKTERDIDHDNAFELNSLAYIKHFNCKSLQEFLNFKFTRGYPIPYRHSGMDLNLNDYFKTCKVTQEKLDYIQQWLDNYTGPKNKDILQKQLNKYKEELK